MSSEINLPAGVPGDELGAASSETSFLFTARTYRVFISYSHADSKWARWLAGRIEDFRVPARFHGQKAPIGTIGARIAPVFRDRDELPTTSDLGETIRSALRQSSTLVVICSPNSAKSRWVQEEILAFKRMGGSARVFAFIVSGEPKAVGTDEDCFSPALRSALASDGTLSTTPAEHVAADARPEGDGKVDAFLRLVSGLLGVGFDELRQREQQRRQRRLLWITAGSVAGMTIALGLAAVAWQARNDAQRRQGQAEDVLAFMVGDFRTELKKVGRLTLLDAVGDKATAYFDSLDPRDLTDTALMQQAKALTQIGENRMDEARYPEAERAFRTAYSRAATMAGRHPQDGEILFDRAQAEYWLGFVNRRRGDLSAASRWLTRYRDSTRQLVALNPTKAAWQQELGFGHHNLAVLDVDQGKLDAARAGFLAELEILTGMSAAKPADLPLQFNLANVVSWLGTVGEQAGDYREAQIRFADQTKRLEALMQKEPGTVRWKVRLAESLALEANLAGATDRRVEARALRRRARDLLDPLVAQDPANRTWLKASLAHRLQEALALLADHDLVAAAPLAQEARAGYEKLTKAEPSDRDLAGLLAAAWRVEAELRAASGRPEAADAAERAIALGEPLLTTGRASETFIGNFVDAAVTAGAIAERGGDHARAAKYWERAAEVAQPFLVQSNNWRLLDPAARALAGLGRGDASRAIIGRLTQFGYRPLKPWPEATGK